MPQPPKLAGWIEAPRLAPIFKQHGRLHIPDILEADDAGALVRAVAADLPWHNTISVEGRGHELPLASLANLSAEVRAGVAQVVAETARAGFQYEFESWRLSDEMEAGRRVGGARAPLEALYDFLNGDTFLGFVRQLTGDMRPAYCDAQVTRYRAGHFLNAHDDQSDGKDRLYAYVLSLTPVWKVDWGGLLLFHDADGHVAEGVAPRFNTLNIFRVPQMHSVSQVASFVTDPRLSVTGWIRSAAAKPKR